LKLTVVAGHLQARKRTVFGIARDEGMSLRSSATRGIAVALIASFVFAADAEEPHSAASPAPPVGAPRQLPPDSVTEHYLALPDRTLTFKATAGAIKLSDESGAEQADVAYVSFVLAGGNPQSRPVTFVFNGGPGASSAWLNLGALGPWRLPMNGPAVYPSATPTLVDNADTWLDFTDLVFIDPPGTGYSKIVASGDEARRKFWSVGGDIDALSVVVRKWLSANERFASPKFIVGESYGGFRGPRLAKALTAEHGVGVNGLILISPVLDFTMMETPDGPFPLAARLPSYAAAARENVGPVSREQLADVEQYAAGEYLIDYLKGPRDAEAVARMVGRVSEITGLDPALVRRLGGRIDQQTFEREFDRAHGKVAAAYDASVRGYDPSPASNQNEWLDSFLEGFQAPLASAMTDLYARRLGWKIDDAYEPLNSRVSRGWDWGRGLRPPESVDALKQMLAVDANLRVLVTHGFSDLQAPYFATKLVLDQIPDYGTPGRPALKVYSGGHMYYSRDESRKALREDARKLIEGQ
jgi:carboxypeptidase C (cathepsin A)